MEGYMQTDQGLCVSVKYLWPIRPLLVDFCWFEIILTDLGLVGIKTSWPKGISSLGDVRQQSLVLLFR